VCISLHNNLDVNFVSHELVYTTKLVHIKAGTNAKIHIKYAKKRVAQSKKRKNSAGFPIHPFAPRHILQ
ncbi:MAG: hypothetical protein WCS42_24865, partial [Verrucomicrobiota bacterium]